MGLLTGLLSKISFVSFKKYLWLVLILFIAGLLLTIWVLNNKNAKLSQENARIQFNNIQLMADNRKETTLYLKQKELSGKYLTERDSLADALKIHPKTITKFVDRILTDHDTVPVEVPVLGIGKDTWKISDSDKCWIWQGIAKLTNDSLNVKRTEFLYSNTITDIYYFQRNKILGLKIGKKKNYHEVRPECGEVSTTEINIIKK